MPPMTSAAIAKSIAITRKKGVEEIFFMAGSLSKNFDPIAGAGFAGGVVAIDYTQVVDF